MGYYLVAIGEDEDAAEAIGVNAPRIKRDIYLISSFLTALAGTFYTQYIYFIDPATAFSFNISIEAALVSIVGGIGTLWGPVIGTVLLETTSTLLQSWLGSSIGGVQLTVYSLILMAVILWRPTGLMGMIERSLATPSSAANRRGRRSDAMAEALVINGLSKRFGGLRAVQDVSFTVKENETVALIGPNGAGKTTSFHLITGFHRPDSGSVSAFGREIVGLKPHDICAHGLARTFQVAKPFGAMTVLDNVMTGAFLRDKNAAVAREKAREAIEFVGLSAREQTAAKDLTTIDQRRLEMARALATQPRLLLLDEVMAGLNPAEIDQAVALVGKLSQRGLTIVIVEHVMRAIMAVARHIVVLDHGQKIAEGTPKEIVENPEVVRAYLGSYVHPPAAGGASAQARRRQRQLRLGARDRQCQHRDRRRRSRRPVGRQRRRQEHDLAGDLGPGEADVRHHHLRGHRPRLACRRTRFRNWALPMCRKDVRYFRK